MLLGRIRKGRTGFKLTRNKEAETDGRIAQLLQLSVRAPDDPRRCSRSRSIAKSVSKKLIVAERERDADAVVSLALQSVLGFSFPESAPAVREGA